MLHKITIRVLSDTLWRQFVKKRAETDKSFQSIGLEMFCAWANIPEPEPEPEPEPSEEDRLIAALESMIRKPRNMQQQQSREWIIALLKMTKGALDQQPENDTNDQP